ncbi:MAG: altronate dehydratase, partial [Lawsonibacter sp.]
MVESMLPIANRCRREPVPVSHLKVGLECGGSDSFSGSSANPALGKAMDLLVRQGGTAVLTEPTELLGVEGALVRRAKSPEVAQKLIDVIHWWLDYCKGRDAQIYGKVTPGNNAGGITNVLEKALGSAKKGGSTPLNGVFGYGEPITESGFVIMNAPSYDPVSAAAMFSGGCNLCAFTTGRGSCYGSQHFPTLKIASNTQLFQSMGDDIDLNAGAVIDGDKTLDEMGQEIFDALIAVASGQPTKSELFSMGSDEFVVWWLGITA